MMYKAYEHFVYHILISVNAVQHNTNSTPLMTSFFYIYTIGHLFMGITTTLTKIIKQSTSIKYVVYIIVFNELLFLH